MARQLGIGLIGTGFMGKCHAMAWNSVATAFGDVKRPRLVHLAEANQELAERKASEFGFEKSTGDWTKLIADPEIDVVSVTTPNAFHAEMVLAALAAGKHVWCEKPMAPTFADAERMASAARGSGKVAVLGYNYIQNPMFRLIRDLLAEKRLGVVNHVRIEMDEDFVADPDDLFTWRNDRRSGYGALDDFAVHPLSFITTLFGAVEQVFCTMARPYADRPAAEGGRKPVETFDICNMLLEIEGGISGVLLANRSAWGRKGRIALQIFGSMGSIAYDQERMNELQLYTLDGDKETRGFRTVMTAPHHYPYGQFCPAPGHGLGFNELKVIEAREMMRLIDGGKAHIVGFEQGLAIERIVHAAARSHEARTWVNAAI